MGAKKNRLKFPYLESIEELNTKPEAENGFFVSPGGAAKSYGCTSEYIFKLEERGHISGYRIRQPRFYIPRLISSKPGFTVDDVFIGVESLRAYAKSQGRELGGPVGPGPQAPEE